MSYIIYVLKVCVISFSEQHILKYGKEAFFLYIYYIYFIYTIYIYVCVCVLYTFLYIYIYIYIYIRAGQVNALLTH